MVSRTLRIAGPKGLAHGLMVLADLALRRGDWTTVRDLGEKGVTLFRQAGHVLGERRALFHLAQALVSQGETAEARRRLEACLLTTRRDDSLSPCLGEAHLMLADLLDEAGEKDAALRHRLGAVVVFERLDSSERAEAVRRTLGGGKETP